MKQDHSDSLLSTDPTLVDLLRRRAEEAPERAGYRFLADGEGSGTPLTWGELDARARAVAASLRAAGAGGERALLLYPPGLDYLVAFFGCLYAGTVAVPVYPPRRRRGMGRVLSVLKDARAGLALTTREVASGLGEALPEGAPVRLVTTDDVNPAIADGWRRPELGSGTLAFLQYTSGSTAEPKGVMLTHGNLLHNLELIRRAFDTGPEDRAVIWLPPYHDMGLIGGILQPLYAGFEVALFSPMAFLQRPVRWVEAISGHRATVSGGPNFAYDLTARKTSEEQRAALDLSSWRVAFNGAEPIRAATLERFARAFEVCGFSPSAFYPCYGLAEGTLLATGGTRGAGALVERFSATAIEARRAEPVEEGTEAGTTGRSRSLVSSGRCAAGQRLAVADPETGEPLAEGRIGEVRIAGPSVAAGYWGRPEQTEATFHQPLGGTDGEEGWLRTGDLGFLRGGELFVTGRIKDLIILRGRNCYPQDLEAAAEACHPALRPGGGAAFGVEVSSAEGMEERLVLVHEVRRDRLGDDPAEIAAAVRRALAHEHEVQLHALALIKPATLPKTSSGKVRRSATRKAYLEGSLDLVAPLLVEEVAAQPASAAAQAQATERAAEAPAADGAGSEIALWLAAEVARLAAVPGERIDPRRPLDEHGLDSLSVMELAHAVEERFRLRVPIERLFGTSIETLAAEVAAGPADGGAPDTGGEEAPEVGDHPLSHNQLSLWFLHALEPESPAYNVPAAVRLCGDVDPDALAAAVADLVARHPALRTRFTAVRGEPAQRVAAAGEWTPQVAEEDARGWSESRLEERLRDEARRPFDLEAGPPLRVFLFRRSAMERVLLLVMHHAVTDFWSLGILIEELGELYRTRAEGRPAETAAVPPAPGRYTDWARRQLQRVDGPRGEADRAWWSERLGGELPVLELPTDRPRPRVQGDRGATWVERFSPAATDRLLTLGRSRGATPFMTLAALFQALLHRYTGQREVLLGTVTAGRTDPRFARTVGYFVNPLVLRAPFGRGSAAEDGFGSFIEAVRDDALGALAHQDYPFSLLVEHLAPERDPGRSPLFQAMLVYQRAELAGGEDLTPFALNEPGAEAEVAGLALTSQPLDLGIAQFDVTLTAGRVDGALVASFDYNVDLFDGQTVERMARAFRVLAEGAAARPDMPVSELPLLTEAEERQIVAAWNDTRSEYRRDATLVDLFEEQAARTPEAEAVRCAGRSLTYAQVARRARALARELRARRVDREIVVGVLLERSPELLVAVLGVLEAGAAYLPLDPHDPEERLAHTLDDASVCLAVTEERFAGVLDPEKTWPVHLPEDPGESAEDGAPPLPRPAATDLACIIYTSGSTGAPKGVLLDHRSLVNLVSSFLESYQPTPADRILPLTSLAHASFVGEIFPLLAAGGTLVLPTGDELVDTAALLQLIAGEGVTILSTVPSLLATLNAAREELPRLRLVLVGGEALAAGDVDKLIGSVRIVNGYGLTEAAVCSTVHTLDEQEIARRRPRIGRPVINTRVYVLDERLHPRPVGCVGEIHVAGDGLARGYHRRPALTAERFLPDPFQAGARMYRTGDLGRWDGDGVLECLGRIDQQVKLRGFRIEPGEIESALALHDAVQEVAVMVRDDGGEARLAAYVVAVPGRPRPTPGALLAHLRERLPEYMVPATFLFLDALPLGPTGKVDHRALPAPAQDRPELASAYRAPKSELERRIAAVWAAVLGVDEVGLDDNFFDLGGHSLLMTRVHARLKEELDPAGGLSLIDLFKYPTVGSLAAHLAPEPGGARSRAARPAVPAPMAAPAGSGSRDVAIVGMAGRFPGAKSPQELWGNLVAGVEGITFFSDEELLAAGIDPELVADPDYVKAKGILGDVDLFDAGFFGLNPREVELMDPQHRVFLECCWEALERAGYDPERYPGSVGVYGGESMNTYLLTNLLPHMELVASVDTLQASLGNDKDPLTSRVSYKLGLLGPSITIQSASSTSLVAIHVACQALLQRNCDMALAGGVSIHLPEVSGYRYQEGGTTARDGHCRAFDASSTGFVSGHGAAVAVLKRLDDALADGDHVHAVIKAAACNNDGSVKVSYMAPSVEGQVDVYRRAYAEAGVSPASVGYVECHGTGTALGDPIEITALTQVFGAATERRGVCAIGSLKTNIGHLDTAAGASGLLKAALALEHRVIPPSLHFERPNPQIDFDSSPFFVNTELRAWAEPEGGGPRRAAVTSLGMGGTNAHAVLEEAPARQPAPEPARRDQLLVLSAKSETALDAATGRLAAALDEIAAATAPESEAAALADVAYTLQVGRKCFPHRRVLLARDLAGAATALGSRDPERLLSGVHGGGDRPVAFLFPGQGAQYPGMARGLYDTEATFRDDLDRCAELLVPRIELDLRDLLYPKNGSEATAAEALRQTAITQPALFAVSWAVARLWMRWGVRPSAMLGHSIGEYAAACLAGVMSLEDALTVVAARGSLMQQMPAGGMLAVPLAEREVLPLLERHGGGELCLAAVNRPAVSVVAGPDEAIDELTERLRTERGLSCRRLHTSHAFHSRMMEPVLPAFTEVVQSVRLEPPEIPYVSNVTGTWIEPAEATDPAYYARQLRSAVRYADGVATLLDEPQRVLLETGPGNTLSTLARQHPARRPEQAVISCVRHPKEERDDQEHFVEALGRVWLTGAEVDWDGFWAGEGRRRVPLPTYPFERRRYWVDPPAKDERRERRTGRRRPEEWYWAPAWRRAPVPRTAGPTAVTQPEDWLLVAAAPAVELAGRLAAGLTEAGHRVAVAETTEIDPAGRRLERLEPQGSADRYRLALAGAEGEGAAWGELLDALAATGHDPTRIVDLATVAGEVETAGTDTLLERAFHRPLDLAREIDRRRSGDRPVRLSFVSDGLQEVTGDEPLSPVKATLLGPCGVIPREMPGIDCRSIDLDSRQVADGRLAERLLAELARDEERPVALRGRHRWVRGFERVPLAAPDLPPPVLRPEGVYLVTGGLGGLGLEVAETLARQVRARLVLVGRSPFPERSAWETWRTEHPQDDPVSAKIGRLLAFEAAGAEVLTLSADVSRPAEAERVLAAAVERFGAVHGVVHAAGVAGGGMIATRGRGAAEAVLAPKVRGTLAIEAAVGRVLDGRPLELLVLFSSITGVLPQIGQADYAAANCFLDAFAARGARPGAGPGDGPAPVEHTVSIAWDAWKEVGMAATTEVPAELASWRRETLRQGLSPAEGRDAFLRALGSGLNQVVVSTLDLEERLAAAEEPERDALAQAGPEGAEGAAAGTGSAHPRPALANAYVAPDGALQEEIAAVWREMLGIDRVGVHDNFFDLGGNSLAGLRITRAIKERLAVGISDVSLYEAPTVSALATLIGEQNGSGGDGRPAADAPTADAAGPAPAPQPGAAVASQARGERRKARLLARRGRGPAPPDGAPGGAPGEEPGTEGGAR